MTTIAVLGTGYMGAPMARNLAEAGHAVRVWNRSREKAAPLATAGATVAESPADAVRDAEIVITMLSEGPVVADVIRHAADGLGQGMVWLQMSTVGAGWADDLAALAAELGVTYVDAPVLGTTKPAQDGQLTVLASGADGVRDRVAPVFEVVGSIALAEHLGIDPREFLDAIDGGAVGAPYAQIKGPMMIERRYPTSFPAHLARKDVGLILDAAGDDLHMRLAAAVFDHFDATVDAGHGDDDMAAVRQAV
jgi:3-hydroxyisobutyrate dehydrogenase